MVYIYITWSVRLELRSRLGFSGGSSGAISNEEIGIGVQIEGGKMR